MADLYISNLNILPGSEPALKLKNWKEGTRVSAPALIVQCQSFFYLLIMQTEYQFTTSFTCTTCDRTRRATSVWWYEK